MNLLHDQIAELCHGLKLQRLAADWPGIAQRAAAEEAGYALVIPHIFDHMDIPRTMSSSRRIPFQITSFPGGLSFFLAR